MAGYVFKLGDHELIGYFVDAPQKLRLNELIPPASADDFGFDVKWAVDTAFRFGKRARRQRLPDGKRKPRGPNRRQRAIKHLPPTTAGSAAIDIPESSTFGDRWWVAKGLWSIATSNPNSWASAMANVANVSQDDFLLLQETKTYKESTRKVNGNAARRAGWSHCLGLAHRTASSMGSGGRAVLARKGTAISEQANRNVPDLVSHRITVAWVAWGWASRGKFVILRIAPIQEPWPP